MPDDPYSLADLARLAGVTPRTVRYYVSQGLLPAPDAAGPATRYGEGHLLRLRLIRRLQRDHLPLAEIRARLERMEDDEVEAALAVGEPAPPPPMSTDETLAYVRQLMTKAGVAPRFYDRPEAAVADATAVESAPSREAATAPPANPAGRPSRSLLRRAPDEFPMREDPALEPGEPGGPERPGDPKLPGDPGLPGLPGLPSIAIPVTVTVTSRQPTGDRSTWERLSITPDVEIHVRRPLDRRANKLVERLARIARELFDDEP